MYASVQVSGGGKLNPRVFKVRSVHARGPSEEANGEARRSSELSRHAETKTDGEFTPALCAWIIHAPPGLSPGWTAAVLLSSVSFRGRPIATDDDDTRRKKWRKKITKKENRKRTRKRRARLTKRMDRRRRVRAGRAGIKYYSRIPVSMSLLRSVTDMSSSTRGYRRWYSDAVEYHSRRLPVFSSENVAFAIITAID